MKSIIKSLKLDKIKNFQNGKKILIADRGRMESLMKNYSAIKILETKYDLNPFILTQGKKNSEINLLYESLGFKKIFKFSDKINLVSIIFDMFLVFIKFCECSKYFIKKDFLNFINNFKVSNVYIGDLIYDRYIRNDYKYLRPSFFDIKFLKIFFVCVYKTIFFEKFLKSNNFSLIIVNTHIYMNNYSILFKLSKKLGINLLYLKDFQISYFKNGQYNRENDPRILTKKKLKRISLSKEKVNKLKKHMQKRTKGKLDHFDVKAAFGKEKYKINQILKKNKINLKEFKKKVLIASHSLSDANHFYFEYNSRSFFYDYHSHVIKTLDFAKKNKEILFLIRPHPSSKFWNEDGLIKKILQKFKSNNILYVDNKIGTHQILKFVDTCITVHGTIGIEQAGYYFKKPILAGKGIYSNLGFTNDAKDIEDYFNLILSDKSKHNLNKKEKINAMKALYYFEIIVKKEYTSFINRKKILLSEKNYLRDLSIYLKKNKIENDLYFKKLKDKLINQKVF